MSNAKQTMPRKEFKTEAEMLSYVSENNLKLSTESSDDQNTDETELEDSDLNDEEVI